MLLEIFVYVTVAAFIVFTVVKAINLAKMPMHNRWELYPVPKEKGRNKYGGSYYEEVLWWQKPRQTSFIDEIVDMFKEIFFIKKLFDNQRPFWWLSYAMHLGFYFLIAWAVLLFFGGITEIYGVTVAAGNGWWATLLFYLIFLTGVLGGGLAAVGSLALLIKRLADPTFKIYTTPQEYFNLIFIFVVALTGIILWTGDPTFAGAISMAASLLSLEALPPLGGLMRLHLVLLGLLLIYIPISKMSHYVGKFFTYHKVFWDNEPNLPNSPIMKAVEEGQKYKPRLSWSAPHIKSLAEQDSKQREEGKNYE